LAALEARPGVIVRVDGVDASQEVLRQAVVAFEAAKRFEGTGGDHAAEIPEHGFDGHYRVPLHIGAGAPDGAREARMLPRIPGVAIATGRQDDGSGGHGLSPLTGEGKKIWRRGRRSCISRGLSILPSPQRSCRPCVAVAGARHSCAACTPRRWNRPPRSPPAVPLRLPPAGPPRPARSPPP